MKRTVTLATFLYIFHWTRWKCFHHVGFFFCDHVTTGFSFTFWLLRVSDLQLHICVAICTHSEAWCPSYTADIPRAPWSWSWVIGWTTAGVENRNVLFMFQCYCHFCRLPRVFWLKKKKKKKGLFSVFISVRCFLTVDKKVDHLDDKHRHRWMFIHFLWYLSQNNHQNSEYS